MSLSMFDVSVPVFVRGLANLSSILSKGAADAETRKIAPSVFINSRLAPDMYPLAFQVQMACDTAKFAVARITGVDAPRFEDNEQTFPELLERIAKTTAWLESVPKEAFDNAATREFVVKIRGADTTIAGQRYLMERQVPNFFFHVTTAYNILRHNGVQVGKRDYLG